MKRRVHVNQHVLRRNRKTGQSDPVVSIRTYKGTERVRTFLADGGELVASPAHPLSCGAKYWFETSSPQVQLDSVPPVDWDVEIHIVPKGFRPFATLFRGATFTQHFDHVYFTGPVQVTMDRGGVVVRSRSDSTTGFREL
jgi:hypothetical protein